MANETDHSITGLKYSQWYIAAFLASATLLIHILVSTNYELHRDAYLYLAEADHLAWGYLSIPPLTPFVLHIWELLFGNSVIVLRLVPALIGAISIFIITQIVQELGGKKWAVMLAGLAYVVAPAFLRSNSLIMPVAFDSLFWLLSSWAMIRLLRTANSKWWIGLGIIFGIGFLNKYSIIFPAFTFLVGLVLTKQRKLLRTRWVFYGILIGLMLILPNLLWQYNHRWPVFHHMILLRESQLVHVRLADFLFMQVFMIFPAIPVFLAGIIYIFHDQSMLRYRAIGWMYIVLILLMISLSGKFYYTLGIYPVFFAIGGVGIEHYTMNNLQRLRPAIAILLVLIIIPALPMSLPILSYPAMIRYDETIKTLGLEDALRWEDGTVHPLPQDYADMIGWKELASTVESTWNSLTITEQKSTAIYAENYGEAGAIYYYTKQKRIPPPISFSDNFLLWAPDSASINTLIYVNSEVTDIRQLFDKVTLVGQITNPYAREHGVGVYLCRKPVDTFKQYYSEKVKTLKANYHR